LAYCWTPAKGLPAEPPLGGAVVLGPPGEVVVGFAVVAGPPPFEPGKHCEYQSLEKVQVYPETQLVAPVQPFPPPGVVRKKTIEIGLELTLRICTALGEDCRCDGRNREKGVLQGHCDCQGI